jgi:hypothetical protein
MISAALRFAAMTLLLVAAGPARAGDNLLTTPGAAARAVEQVVAKIGRSPSVSLVEITPDGVTLNVQGDKPFHVDEWRWTLLGFWLFETPSCPDVRLSSLPDTLKQRTLERINLQGGKVSRLTFERGNVFVASPHGQVLVEIRVEAGYRSGRVTYEPDGTELDVVLP